MARERRGGRRSPGVYVLLAALVFQGLSGLAGGFGLLRDPTGGAIGLPLEWLEGSPFEDYQAPGIVLFFVLGVAPLAVAGALWTRRSWSWLGAAFIGAALVVWIAVQILVIGYQPDPPLQLIYLTLGLLLFGLALTPNVRRYAGTGRASAEERG